MPTELWIHSIHVTVSPSRSTAPSDMLEGFAHFAGSKIDMNKVKSIMADMDKQDLPQQARDLMDRMEMKQKVYFMFFTAYINMFLLLE
jgi:hypothetical protein